MENLVKDVTLVSTKGTWYALVHASRSKYEDGTYRALCMNRPMSKTDNPKDVLTCRKCISILDGSYAKRTESLKKTKKPKERTYRAIETVDTNDVFDLQGFGDEVRNYMQRNSLTVNNICLLAGIYPQSFKLALTKGQAFRVIASLARVCDISLDKFLKEW